MAWAKLVVLMLIGVTVVAHGTDRQETVRYRHGRLSVHFETTPVANAWAETARITGVEIAVPANLKALEPLRLRFDDEPLDVGLKRLLEGFNFMMVYEPDSGGTRVDKVRVLGRITPLPTSQGAITAAQPQPQLRPQPSPVVLQRGRSGHYVANGLIDDQPTEFLIDTGASVVALSAELAQRINLDFGAPKQIETASGITVGYETVLGRVTLGDLGMEQVKAIILPEMQIGGRVLLGMNFLGAFDLIQSQDVLTIQPRE